mmetsp:Transcript_34573/g.60710  ORF Transcript_34573/g.60710 Transcript_34573/m.60710 type:complete len:329 (-) Transcript_34573:240-1226(-)
MAAVASFDTEALAQLLADNSGVINVMQYSNGNRLKQLKWIPGTDYLILIFYHYDYSEQKPALCRVISLRSKEVVRTIELRPDTNSYVMEVRDNLLYFGNGSHLELYDVHSLSLVHAFTFDSNVANVNFVEGSAEAYVSLWTGVHLIDVEHFTVTQKYGRPEDVGFHYVHPPTQLAFAAFYEPYGETTCEVPYNLATGAKIKCIYTDEKHAYCHLDYIRPLDLFGFIAPRRLRYKITLYDTITFEEVSQPDTPVDFEKFLYLSGTNYLIAGSTDAVLNVTDWSVYTILSEVSDPDNPGVKVKFTLFDWNEALRCIVSGSPSGLVRFSVI